MPRTWWGRPRKRRRMALAIGSGVAAMVIGAIVYLNVVERQSLVSSTLATGSTGAAEDEATGVAGQADVASRGEWVSFVGRVLSLELPAWFVGGMPDEARARAALEQLVGMGLDEWVELYTRSSLEQGEVELLMAGAFGAERELIVVAAEADELPPESSLEGYVEELEGWFAGGDLSVEMITKDRALCRLDFRRVDDPTETMISRVVLARWGVQVYAVSYTASADSSETLDSIFDASAGTIVIGE